MIIIIASKNILEFWIPWAFFDIAADMVIETGFHNVIIKNVD